MNVHNGLLIRENDVVAVVVDLPDLGLTRDHFGIVVHVHEEDRALDVQFQDQDPYRVITLLPSQVIKPVEVKYEQFNKIGRRSEGDEPARWRRCLPTGSKDILNLGE